MGYWFEESLDDAPYKDGWAIKHPTKMVSTHNRVLPWYSKLFDTFDEAAEFLTNNYGSKEAAHLDHYMIEKVRRRHNVDWNPLIREQRHFYFHEAYPEDWGGQEQSEGHGWAVFPTKGNACQIPTVLRKIRPVFLYATKEEAEKVLQYPYINRDAYEVREARRVFRGRGCRIEPCVIVGDEHEYVG